MNDREQVSVMVTAIGGGGHGEQILKALRSVDHTRYRIIGADMSARNPQFGMVDQGVLLPPASHPEYIDALLNACQHFDVRVLFHGCEPELKAMSAARERFSEAGVLLPINPPHVIDTCMDKVKTMEFLAKNGFTVPKFLQIQDINEIDLIDFYPVVVKPSVGGGGSSNVFIAQNKKELQILAEYLKIITEPFLVQEYVGTHEQEFTVGVLFDLDGTFINSIAINRTISSGMNMRTAVRNTTPRDELGKWLIISSGISHGQVGDFPDVIGPCEDIATALGARGAINIQCRLFRDKVWVFEINPRFSGTTSIRAIMGYNEPDILIRRHIFGEEITPRFAYQHGWVLRSLQETILSEHNLLDWRDILT